MPIRVFANPWRYQRTFCLKNPAHACDDETIALLCRTARPQLRRLQQATKTRSLQAAALLVIEYAYHWSKELDDFEKDGLARRCILDLDESPRSYPRFRQAFGKAVELSPPITLVARPISPAEAVEKAIEALGMTWEKTLPDLREVERVGMVHNTRLLATQAIEEHKFQFRGMLANSTWE